METLLGQQNLSADRLTDGIDPFAIYSENGDLTKILIRGVGTDSSTFADATINEARGRGESVKALTVTESGEERSTLTQKLLNMAQKAADAICGMKVRPEQVSVSVSVQFVFGSAFEVTYKTAALCEWLFAGRENSVASAT